MNADDVKVNDASARTTAANAYVSGFGGSRHIVLFDTLLRDFPRDQVRAVVAHELAHVARRHVLKGSAWGAALLVPAALLCFAVVGWRTGFAAAGRDEEGADLVLRRLAVVAATVAVLSARAPALQLDQPRLRARGRLARPARLPERRRGDRPPAGAGEVEPRRSRSPEIVQVWFGSHPAALDRIGLALRYRSGER